MARSTSRRVGIALSAVAVLAGAAACSSDSGDKKESKSDSKAAADRTPAQALQAAYKKTADVKSAKVHMTMSMPAEASAAGGDMEMNGVMGWSPSVMDLTMSGAALSGKGGPGATRMLMVDGIVYMQIPEKSAGDMPEEMRGKKWMKFDPQAAIKESGNPELQKMKTPGMDDMNQDPAKQMALLLDSPNLKRVGEEKVNGVQTQHYKGTLTVDEMLKGNKSAQVMDPKDREKLLENIKKSGIKGYDTEFWVNSDDLPVKMNMGIDSPKGKLKMAVDYTDYGAKANVQAPPADQTMDLFKMLKGAGLNKKTPGADDSGLAG